MVNADSPIGKESLTAVSVEDFDVYFDEGAGEEGGDDGSFEYVLQVSSPFREPTVLTSLLASLATDTAKGSGMEAGCDAGLVGQNLALLARLLGKSLSVCCIIV